MARAIVSVAALLDLEAVSLAGGLALGYSGYVDDVAALRKAADVKGLVHVTGGGLPENLPRVLPGKGAGLTLKLRKASWEVPAMFRWMQSSGRVADSEMFRTFNMGVGMIVAVAACDLEATLAALPGSWRIGEVVARGDGDVVQGVPN